MHLGCTQPFIQKPILIMLQKFGNMCIYMINTVAVCYVWENIAFYDFTFCQMMALNPQRSWAKTYNQMWNLVMHEPVHKGPSGQFNGNYRSRQSNRDGGGHRFRRPCWKFNKNQGCSNNCDFDHKLLLNSYCGGSHAVLDCHKLRFKQDKDKSCGGSSSSSHKPGKTSPSPNKGN